MAKKDFDREYQQIANTYFTLKSNVKRFEEERKDLVMSQEQIDNIRNNFKTLLTPAESTYKTWTYIKTLLDEPVKKEKKKKYKNQKQKVLNSIEKKYTKDGIIEQNIEITNKVKEIK